MLMVQFHGVLKVIASCTSVFLAAPEQNLTRQFCRFKIGPLWSPLKKRTISPFGTPINIFGEGKAISKYRK